jgi:hypothetical protein
MLCVLALSALQMAYADDAEVKLARTYKEKDPVSYKQVSKVNANGTDVVRTTVVKDTVKEIKPTGEVVLTSETLSDQIDIGGSLMDLPANTLTITYDKAGKLTDFTGLKDGGAIDPNIIRLIAVAHNILLPEKAVKKDDKWETEVDDPAVKGKKMTLKETFLGTEKRDGKDLWKIKQTVEAPADDSGTKFTSELTALLDPANGRLIHSEGSVQGVPTSMYGVLGWTEESNLQKPDDTKKTADADKKP